jgi:DNA-binding NarL/FixJ family response regulator
MQTMIAASENKSIQLKKLMIFLFDEDNSTSISNEVSADALPYYMYIKENLKDPQFKAAFYNTLMQINASRNKKPSKPVTISTRETEIAELLLKGLKYHQIADKLCICMDTVFTHIRHLYKKMNVCSRVEMASRILYCNSALALLIFSLGSIINIF